MDGFRFDLASILSRDEQGRPMASPPLLWDIESDPVAGQRQVDRGSVGCRRPLSGRRSFLGDSWKEWNGRFRDDVRAFIKGDDGTVHSLAYRLTGSPDVYGHEMREPEQSVNFVTCHDGFTLNDLVSYNTKHNEANGDDNTRWRVRQPELELRRRGADRRSRGGAPAQPPGEELPGADAAVGGHADAADGRRGAAHPARQQQRLLPAATRPTGSTGTWSTSTPTSAGSRSSSSGFASSRSLPSERFDMTLQRNAAHASRSQWHGVKLNAPDWGAPIPHAGRDRAPARRSGAHAPHDQRLLGGARVRDAPLPARHMRRGGAASIRRSIRPTTCAAGRKARPCPGRPIVVQPRSVVLLTAAAGSDDQLQRSHAGAGAGRKNDHDPNHHHRTPNGPARHQHDPHAVDGCGAGRQLRPSRDADGARAAGLHAVEPRHAVRPAGSDLARPRPLRAVERPRVDAAVVGAAPDRHAGRECRVRDGWASRRSRSTTSAASASLGSQAPGHPEYHLVSGVETTTGPLGQGIATSVGMAIAQRWLARRYNQPGFDIFDYDIYADLRRRLPDGRRRLRSGVARRPPRSRQPVLDLRQQPHHDRRQHATRIHRGRRRALPRLRVERAARRRCQRHRRASSTRSQRFARPRAGRR